MTETFFKIPGLEQPQRVSADVLDRMTADYYDTHFAEYAARTRGIDPSSFLEMLASRLPKGARVLDVGCGSGRDLLWLKERGFDPTGFELSPGLAGMAEEYSGCSVIRGDFLLADFSGLKVDAVILVGALVHLRNNELAAALARICRALVPGGLLYISLKEGKGRAANADGRVFELWEHDALTAVFAASGLHLLEFRRSASALPTADAWLGYLLQQGQGGA